MWEAGGAAGRCRDTRGCVGTHLCLLGFPHSSGVSHQQPGLVAAAVPWAHSGVRMLRDIPAQGRPHTVTPCCPGTDRRTLRDPQGWQEANPAPQPPTKHGRDAPQGKPIRWPGDKSKLPSLSLCSPPLRLAVVSVHYGAGQLY